MKRGAATILLAFGLVAPAGADTLVLRGGEHVEVGEAYRIDGSRFEYRTSSGEVRRVDLGEVDLQATARANGESVSAFVDRASRRGTARGTAPPAAAPPAAAAVAAAPSVGSAPPPTRARRAAPKRSSEPAITVTNADLEPYRIERERLDAEYRRRHPEVAAAAALPEPYPSPSDDASSDTPGGYTEQDWRDQATYFRDQLDAEQAQIDTIRDEVAYRQANPFKYGLNYRYNYGDAPITVRRGRAYSIYSPGNPTTRAEEEFSQLNSRLIDLEIQHRATMSRWNAFQERARRAGVPPGWLRE